ncbi:hypothetical protein JHN63_15085 [Streptomyces sp. MBT65]|uniref:hypothetical protein n=1 Tax=Streptomyces sp. MBT65 TaxID=1488395 RepID=UPI00190E08AB|nr:hypothetical protein [Streptomyces sp. MBT65]MBK3575112.1 hypothetical protein [Streptomyces sp. MBT65]
MTHLPVPAAEPHHSSGGAGGAARAEPVLPPWHHQKVKVPKRVWGTARYSAGAVAYHAQVTALGQRPDGCRAGVLTLAGYMGDSKRTAERYLAELSAPGQDGIPELTTIRHTDGAGDGETAERHARGLLTRSEHFAFVSILAAKALRHPLFVLYCALAYAVATKTPVTAAELAGLLDVTERSARRMTDELEDLGWITVHRRTGDHGRHEYDVHDHPLHLVTDEPLPPDTHGGSGADTTGGSLASKEDPELTDERAAQVGGAFRRRRDQRNVAPPVDTGSNSTSVPPTLRGPVRPAARPAYAGPQLTLSPRVWAVLEPVHDLLPGVRPFVVRRIGREIGRQLDTGIWPDEIRDQITRLRHWTPDEQITDPGRWLLGAVLPVRSKCGTAGCHWGFLAHTGMPCKACAEIDTAHPPHTSTARPHACGSCGWTSPTPLPLMRCAACRPTA